MKNPLANIHWLQNNNNSPGPHQQNQPRPNSGQGPNGQPPQRVSSINRWLLIIVLLMLGVYLFQFFNTPTSNNNATRVEMPYSQFYQQIQNGNVRTVTLIGDTDI